MKLQEIANHPTVLSNNHESLYRSYHILKQVMEMVNRGDSKETIAEVVELLNQLPEPFYQANSTEN